MKIESWKQETLGAGTGASARLDVPSSHAARYAKINATACIFARCPRETYGHRPRAGHQCARGSAPSMSSYFAVKNYHVEEAAADQVAARGRGRAPLTKRRRPGRTSGHYYRPDAWARLCHLEPHAIGELDGQCLQRQSRLGVQRAGSISKQWTTFTSPVEQAPDICRGEPDDRGPRRLRQATRRQSRRGAWEAAEEASGGQSGGRQNVVPGAGDRVLAYLTVQSEKLAPRPPCCRTSRRAGAGTGKRHRRDSAQRYPSRHSDARDPRLLYDAQAV